MQDNSNNRILWIDEYKGFVLLLVCLFHAEQSFKCIDMGMLHLSAMRMSAFFFISGVLFSTRRFSTFRSYAVHKTKVLLLPYIWLSLLFLALDPVIWNFDWYPLSPKMSVLNTRPVIDSVGSYIYWNLAKIFVAGKSSVGSGPVWFVFTLYSVSLLFFPIVLLSTKGAKKPWVRKAVVAVIAAASLLAGWALSRYHIRLPLSIERDLTCLAFFAFGYVCKDFLKSMNSIGRPGLTRNLAVLLGTIISLIAYFFIESPDPNFSIMNNDLGKSLPRFVFSSFFGIAALIGFFQLASQIPDCAPVRIVKGILRNISRNALIILAVHWWILLVLRICFKQPLDKPGIAYLSLAIVLAGVLFAIPLFRNKLYKLLGKEKISVKESLSIK